MRLPEAVLVLAGGTAQRLGGVSKPDYKIGPSRLIDIAIDEVEHTGFRGRIVVIAPGELDVREGVELTLEDPPHGGPLAGVGAGIAALENLPGSAIVALMTCDAPLTPRLWGELCSKLDEVDAAIPMSGRDEARPQYLHGCYRLRSLRRVSVERNASIRQGFAQIEAARVVDENWYCMDVDTPADAEELAVRLGLRLA